MTYFEFVARYGRWLPCKQFKSTDDLKVWWRLWSVRLGVAGTLITSAFVALPEMATSLWYQLPYEVRILLPAKMMPFIGIGLFILSMLARFVRQHKAADALAKQKAEAIEQAKQEILAQQAAGASQQGTAPPIINEP